MHLGCICLNSLMIPPSWSGAPWLGNTSKVRSPGCCVPSQWDHRSPSSSTLPRTSFPLSPLYLPFLKHARLSPSSGLCPCSSLPDILLPEFFEWLIHSHVSGLSLDVTCSGKPPALPLSHHPMCVLQSIDLHNVTCIFIWLLSLTYIKQTVNCRRRGVFVFSVCDYIPSSLEGFL